MRGLFHMDNPVINCLNKLVDCFVLSLCWIAASLPIITIGASCGALYRTVCRSIRRDEGYPLRMFWETYRKNLKNVFLHGCQPVRFIFFSLSMLSFLQAEWRWRTLKHMRPEDVEKVKNGQ